MRRGRPHADPPPLMRLDQVRYAYRRHRPVVCDISADLHPGRLHVIMGPNGSGKSTLLRLMLGDLKPGAGRVELNGRRVHRWRAARRAAWMSYVPQRTSSAFAFTTRQVVAMGRFALPPDEQAIEHALDACEVRELSEQPFVELSVGQQQRVLLARAIAQAEGAGQVMLLDEPTSAMDLSHVHQAMQLLRRLAAGGLAAVVVMQELNLAARYADHVWLLDRGRLVADGAWDVVLDPKVLEPVYQVKVRPIVPDADRPVFDVRLPAGGPQR